MNHDDPQEYPLEWLLDAPAPEWDRDTPKTAALDARLLELRLAFAEDEGWLRLLWHLAEDAVNAEEVAELLLRVLIQDCAAQFGCHGRDETIGRLRDNLELARAAAREERFGK